MAGRLGGSPAAVIGAESYLCHGRRLNRGMWVTPSGGVEALPADGQPSSR